MIPLLLLCILASPPQAVLTMATTTSVENSGLLDALIPVFEATSHVKVRYVAVGTGQALRLGRDGNTDLLFVHDRTREEAFVREGYGTCRVEVMTNHFTLVGPPEKRAAWRGGKSCDLFRWIREKGFPFVSRGDESGTHTKEKSLWKVCGLTPPSKGYLDAGSGMITTLRVASEKGAFTLTDTATFLSHAKELALVPYLEEDPVLLNTYTLIPVNPKRFPGIHTALGEAFIRFCNEGRGREIITSYGTKRFGRPLFTPLVRPDND